MALDRQSIEKRDFPIGRRGYEPEAVDAHLATLAAEVDSLQRSSRRKSGESLASAASEQVRSIVEAAESSAAEIERSAEEEASRIRSDASREAERIRDEAVDRARNHVGKVSESTALMLQRVDAMEAELTALVDSLRTGANRLTADLSLLDGNMGDLYGASGSSRGPSGSRTPAIEPAAETEAFASARPVAGPTDPEPVAVAASPAPAASPPASAAASADDADVEGARLIALNMALNGQSREETDRYLADNFDLGDRSQLLDEVYDSVDATG